MAQTWISIGFPVTTTKCEPPTSFTVLPTTFQTDVIAKWSGAKAGTGNGIVGYRIESRTSYDGIWSAYALYNTITFAHSYGQETLTPYSIPGGRRQFRICTRGSAGEAYWSDWAYAAVNTMNSAPTKPTIVTVSKQEYEQGDEITLSWSNVYDVDQNIIHYEISYRTTNDPNDFYGSLQSFYTLESNLTSGNIIVTPPFVEGEPYIQYYIVVVDVYNKKSDVKAFPIMHRKEDSGGIKIGDSGVWKIGTMYVGVNGEWKIANVSFGSEGIWKPA